MSNKTLRQLDALYPLHPFEREAVARLKTVQEHLHKDPEIAHKLADDILCELLEQLGCRETVRIFMSLKKRYS